ncbi:MAG: geranylgeranylglyceryl/heptaprenylglyceryl phosphate synthase [Phaeodactylibacter sp.]|nr:geranylgeranylglyceryl/heptaprenylglyceryl phosphate synthase [Phaeodactylibacter sp.]MCB9272442.1 geranylgeranylglyceryl/heptaprenylglyceryl phosphate synthase [Lewinellaceae bacterium]
MAGVGKIYQRMQVAKDSGHSCFALLADPDKANEAQLVTLARQSDAAGVDFLFLGGSLLMADRLALCLKVLRDACSLPIVLFPGSPMQINHQADALLFLSLISGRNPELLIGQQVVSAPYLHRSPLEVIGTGYMLIDGGQPTTVSYMSHTTPIPHDKPDIALATALAGEMLGLRLAYLDAGSGAQRPVSAEMIRRVSNEISVPLLTGGGIRTPELARQAAHAGADVVVVGNAIERDIGLLREMVAAVR